MPHGDVLWMRKTLLIGIALAVAAAPALAVEGAMGRTLPGIWIRPQSGVVGPASGFSFSILPIGYMGSIGGSRLLPIGSAIVSNIDASISANYLVPQYVYKTETNKVSLASSFMGPVNWASASGSHQLNNLSRSASSTNAGLGVPLTGGIHLSENNNLAINSLIFAPTGAFRSANLSNLGMGGGPLP
jgi:hypothetical protein